MDKIDKFYDEHMSNKVGLDSLLEMIEKEFRLFEEKSAEIDYSDINISLPTIKITEDWGRMSTKDRAIIENFTKRIQGNTLEQKLESLNSILTTKKEKATVSDILSTMVVCEILSSILREFTESAGGFIFEGFLAGLFGGESVQITGPEDIGSGATGKPITDVILNNRHYSLKLLGQKTAVAGSFRNMVEHFTDYDHVVYLDGRRIGKDQGLEFGEFIITLPRFLDVFLAPFLREVTSKGVKIKSASELKKFLKKLDSEGKPIKTIVFDKAGFAPERQSARTFGYSPKEASFLTEELLQEIGVSGEDLKKILARAVQMEDEELQQFGPFTLDHADKKFEGTKAEKLFGSMAVVDIVKRNIESGNKDQIINSLKQTPGYKSKEQFEFTRKQAEKIAGFRVIGTLMIGEKQMKQTWSAYADLLKETIGPVYSTLQQFTNNVNNYFLDSTEGSGQNRKQFAMDAIKDAMRLQTATENAVQTIDKKDN